MMKKMGIKSYGKAARSILPVWGMNNPILNLKVMFAQNAAGICSKAAFRRLYFFLSVLVAGLCRAVLSGNGIGIGTGAGIVGIIAGVTVSGSGTAFL
ncbi:MAG TPA: hypothetical protein VHO84_01200 [Syntrophorhabdaceae bacterium]|nr:hypothetical protein [Syntrophorhabdaceae bacterium]